MIILCRLLHHLAKLPARAKEGDAGYDLSSIEAFELLPGRHRLVKTGVSMAIPRGWYGRLAGRSGLAAKQGIAILGGVVDSTYRGDIGVIVHNTSQDSFQVHPGDRIAQIVFEQHGEPELVETPEALPETVRGTGGFGSTGGTS